MNFKHMSIGMLCLLIGVMILSPLDEMIILIPLAYYTSSPEILPGVMCIGAILLAIGIFLVGKSTLVHMGVIGKTVAHHPVVIIGSVFIVSLFLYCWITGVLII